MDPNQKNTENKRMGLRKISGLTSLALVIFLSILVIGIRNDWNPFVHPPLTEDVYAFIDAGDYAKALEYLNQTIESGEAYPEAYAVRGNLYSMLRRFSLAILDYSEYLNTIQDSEIFSRRCNAYRMRAMYDSAIQDCEASIHLNPDSSSGYINLALVRLDQGDYSSAEKALDTALALDRDSSEVYFAQFQLYISQGIVDKALDALDGCIKADPHNIPCYWERGQLRLGSADVVGAISDYQEIIDRGEPKIHGEYMYKAGSQLRFIQ